MDDDQAKPRLIPRTDDRGAAPAEAAPAVRAGNASPATRVPQYWQKRTSSPFEFPHRPHLVMSKGFASGGIL
jgi:hypothetical protein